MAKVQIQNLTNNIISLSDSQGNIATMSPKGITVIDESLLDRQGVAVHIMKGRIRVFKQGQKAPVVEPNKKTALERKVDEVATFRQGTEPTFVDSDFTGDGVRVKDGAVQWTGDKVEKEEPIPADLPMQPMRSLGSKLVKRGKRGGKLVPINTPAEAPKKRGRPANPKVSAAEEAAPAFHVGGALIVESDVPGSATTITMDEALNDGMEKIGKSMADLYATTAIEKKAVLYSGWKEGKRLAYVESLDATKDGALLEELLTQEWVPSISSVIRKKVE